MTEDAGTTEDRVTPWDVYKAWPDRDLLGVEFNEHTTFEEAEQLLEDAGGDTLFLFAIQELCNDDDIVTRSSAVARLGVAIADLAAVRTSLQA